MTSCIVTSLKQLRRKKSSWRRLSPLQVLLRYKLRSRNWATLLPVTNRLQCEPRETPTEAEKLVTTARSTGNDTQSSN
jgi:hypothetical protein